MRVLIINRFFWPDESATAMLAADLAEDLVRAGHEVHVACAKLGYDGSTMNRPRRDEWNGITIHRLPSLRFGRKTRWGRALDLASFHAALWSLAPFLTRPDMVVCMTDPPLALGAAAWIARLRGAKLVQHTMDVYPEVAIYLNALSYPSRLTSLLTWLDRRWLAKCDGVIALGDCMAEQMRRKGVAAERLLIAPPWSDPALLQPIPREANAFRQSLGLAPDSLLIMYSGNFGQAHLFGVLLRLMREMTDDPRWHFALAGGGAHFGWMTTHARKHLPPERLHIFGYAPRAELNERLAAADLQIVTQAPLMLGLVLPSKVTGVLAVGVPVLFIGPSESEAFRAVTDSKCGYAFDPSTPPPGGQVDHMAPYHAIEPSQMLPDLNAFADDPELRKNMAAAARALFESDYTRPVVTESIIAWLESIAGPPRSI